MRAAGHAVVRGPGVEPLPNADARGGGGVSRMRRLFTRAALAPHASRAGPPPARGTRCGREPQCGDARRRTWHGPGAAWGRGGRRAGAEAV